MAEPAGLCMPARGEQAPGPGCNRTGPTQPSGVGAQAFPPQAPGAGHGQSSRARAEVAHARRVKVMALHLALSDLHFQPQQHIAFNINNASISLRFRRQLLYWFL